MPLLPELSDVPTPAPGRLIRLPVCQVCADALLIAELAQRHAAEQRLLVVVTSAALDAQRLLDECRWFAPDLRIACLSDWETLTYDSLSPHQELVPDRPALHPIHIQRSRRSDTYTIKTNKGIHKHTNTQKKQI